MSEEVRPAESSERARLEALFELYAYDFSELLAFDVEDDGRFHPPSLAEYWTDPTRHPFLILIDAKLAGFALVRRGSRLRDDSGVWDMAEFFVLRRYRRRGVGQRAASFLFDRFPGRWEVRQRAENTAATQFWRRVIARHAGGEFEDLTLDDARWRGAVQRFTSGA